MGQRTTKQAVIDILTAGQDYDGTTDVQPYINAATLIISRVAECAQKRAPAVTLSADELREMESWLSAHAYVMSDQTYASKSTAGASASFHGQTTMHLEASKYGQMALDIDFSGCLTAISKRQVARAFWLGKPPSEQIPVDERD